MATDILVKKTRAFRLDILAMLALPCASAWYFYGTRALALVAVSALTAAVCELLGRKLMRSQATVGDFSAVATGVMIALVLPANAPLWLPAVGSSFAVLAAKLPFGNVERLPFSPAAAGVAFLTICFPDLFFAYPKVSSATASLSVTSGVSLASLLSKNTSISLSSVKAIDIFTGNFPGTMGAGCIAVLAGSAIYMLIRRTSSFISIAGFITGSALIAVCFPRVTSLFSSVILELAAGYLIFAALFFITEPGTQPKQPLSCLLFGFFGGIICMLMRRFGAFEECACFAVLILDAVWPVADRWFAKLTKKERADLPPEQKEVEAK